MTLNFDHYAIFVDDLARSAEFYRDILGLEQIPEPFRDGLHLWFRIADAQQLHIITPRQSGTPPSQDVHFAFRVNSLNEIATRLESLGVPYGDERPYGKARARPDGVRQIFFQDPDGHWLEVNEARY